MKKRVHSLILSACLALAAGCGKEEPLSPRPVPVPDERAVPEGYFVATFGVGGGQTRALTPTFGPDGRVQHIRYLLFKQDDGAFVKERNLWLPAQGAPTWPFDGVIRDTLPKGAYTAVFLGNVSEDVFDYAGTFDVLTGYESGYANGRIWLPPIDFSPTTEYYLAKTAFSDAAPAPSVMLQRIIGAVSLHRNTVDASDALDMLTDNIIRGLKYGDIISDQIDTLLPGLLTDALSAAGVTTLFGVLDEVLGLILGPITDALLEPVLKLLVNELGAILTGNSDQAGMLSSLDMLVNPWALATAHTAIVTIEDFPRSVDLDLNAVDVFEEANDFAFALTTSSLTDERDVLIRGFEGMWNIENINVVKEGLVAGLVIDVVADDLLLPGALVDIDDPLTVEVGRNWRYANNYSLLGLGLQSYDPQQGAAPLVLNVRLGDVLNVDAILGGIPVLGTLLNALLNPVITAVGNITLPITLVNVPLLGINDLTLSGSWGETETF